MQSIIRTEHLSLRYRGSRVPAVDAVSVDIPSSSFVGIVGPNGSGKTSFLKVVAGLLPPSAGRVEIAGRELGVNPSALLGSLGYVPEQTPSYPHLTGREFFQMLAELSGLNPKRSRLVASKTLSDVGLDEIKDDRIGKYSHGMGRRLILGQALLCNPEILILDEPFNGLDLEGIRLFTTTLQSFSSAGKTILLSSHDFSQVERFSNWLCIFSQGKLIKTGRPTEILAEFGSRKGKSLFRLRFGTMNPPLVRFLRNLPFEIELAGEAPDAIATLDNQPGQFDSMIKLLASAPEEVVSVEPLQSPLAEAVYGAVAGGI